ncbi:hypothetical protein [Novosphingobium malaysiense]|nr:hypothetical protein [Novosphingobium malaysiense]
MDVTLAASLLALLIITTMAAGIWLLLHLTALTAVFRGNADLVASPSAPRASRGKVIAAVALFNLGWIGSVVVWSLAIGA